MHSKAIAALAVLTASIGLLCAGVGAQSSAPPGNAKHGYAVFVGDGCWECHGYQGQGAGRHGVNTFPVGPSLAPKPIAYAAFIKQVRTPRRLMPVYSTDILSDKDAADVYAYLASIPPAKDASTIPLLKSVPTDAK